MRILPLFSALSLVPLALFAYPPGSPLTDFGPNQVAVGFFFDHSGQELFNEADRAHSVLNTTGLNADYAPWNFIQVGLYVGAAEFDVQIPPSKAHIPTVRGFASDWSLYGGSYGKLTTPRFLFQTTRIFVYGSSSFFRSEDNRDNKKQSFLFNSGGGVQVQVMKQLNLALGGESYILLGEQESSTGIIKPFSNRESQKWRGLIAVEAYPPGITKTFVSVAFRPVGKFRFSKEDGWDEYLGIKNASLSISLGVFTDLIKKGGHLDEELDENDLEE